MNQETSSPSLLFELTRTLNLHPAILSVSELYLFEFFQRNSLWNESNTNSIVRCSILAASKSTIHPSEKENTSYSISEILSTPNSPDLHSFIFELKKFILFVKLEKPIELILKRIINNFSFSLMLFNKYEEIWNKLKFEGPFKELKKLKEIGWFLFILARINLLQRRTEIVECACMLLGTFNFLLTHLPQEVTYENKGFERDLMSLCELLKAHPEQVGVSTAHLCLMVELYKKHNFLRGKWPNSTELEGIFSMAHLNWNLKELNFQYEQKLLPDEIDEREFLFREETGFSVLNKPASPFYGDHRFSSQRFLKYEEDDEISINTRFNDIKFVKRGFNLPFEETFSTEKEISTSKEMNYWLDSHINQIGEGIPQFLIEKLESQINLLLFKAKFEKKIKNTLDKYSIGKSISNNLFEKFFNENPDEENEENEKLEEAFKLFYKVLLKLIKIKDSQQEIQSESRDEIVFTSETFYKALMAFCLETILFINNITALEFDEILTCCEVSAFDTWKLIKTFIEFDTKLPIALKEYFKALEVKVITYMAWTDDSLIPNLFREDLISKVSYPALLLFEKKVLSHSALRIMDLSYLLGLSEIVREDVWTVMKYALSQETGLFENRHLDQVLICTVYGVCRVKGLNVTFNSLIMKYTEKYKDSGKIFRSVRLDEKGIFGDIIEFYNIVYIKKMKAALLSKKKYNMGNMNRISVLSAENTFKEKLFPLLMTNKSFNSRSVWKSPFKIPEVNFTDNRCCSFDESTSSYFDYRKKIVYRERESEEEDSKLGEPKKEHRGFTDVLNGVPELIEDIPNGFPE